MKVRIRNLKMGIKQLEAKRSGLSPVTDWDKLREVRRSIDSKKLDILALEERLSGKYKGVRGLKEVSIN